jgi:hypothetical protein
LLSTVLGKNLDVSKEKLAKDAAGEMKDAVNPWLSY